ncbi:ATP-dependent DNA helicase RecG [Arcticibacterium luteifluviistationis]|uniref:ATP-dependent DNA helicase RecG n=1 Tax=Arcticibacterium luteifluviistationis TaxID=1784714 RepID=A0A2Z4GHN5_9BACT|nr:ATP-dependent DNA helicase RecG [Arcticibacterium luteifluviistationis]AWW00963.1 ATP-dependent DNA helicase RecG [Arcticibacterium luteifluviistationis]
MHSVLDKKIDFLPGVGTTRASLLNTELGIFTYAELIEHYPFRYEDRSKFYQISSLSEDLDNIQLKGKITSVSKAGTGRKERLVAKFTDGTGSVDLIWFQGIKWVEKKLVTGADYILYGKPTIFGHSFNFSHPEITALTPALEKPTGLKPVYSLTEKLRKKFIDSRIIGQITQNALRDIGTNIPENLPESLLVKYKMIPRFQAYQLIHHPKNYSHVRHALRRLKFEELFYNQLSLINQKLLRKNEFEGHLFTKTELLTKFYTDHLPFELTNAQKKVIKEIFFDFKSQMQMNRLLQGDVGSGKTIVSFICMLMAVDCNAQCCLMAPTEILAIQHYHGLKVFAEKIGLKIALLTGSTKKKERTVIHEELLNGTINIIIGTHALIEDKVQFQNLGLCVIDEQHRFGVAQRAKLWNKNKEIHPHILVMTATPIPRTLAMTLYGDLDVSVIDELPAGRKPIKTVHRYDSKRLEVFQFIREEILKGRQVYIVYPLIEESEKMDFKNLMDGYESIARAFPDNPLSIVHGKMKAKDKDYEMQRFVKGETDIMVATTVIEVGVNVPNASLMIIENSERFGLAQLHQLRGRVGRGAEQSYCILMTDFKLSRESKKRIETMVETNDGFKISEVDLELRGPGDMSGTQQSGLVDLKIANLATDGAILKFARESALEILDQDPELIQPQHAMIKAFVDKKKSPRLNWSRIS